MKLKSFLPLNILALFLMMACTSSTQLQTSWVDPSLTSQKAGSFKKMLVVVALRNETAKRNAEDKIVNSLKHIVGVPSYAYLNPGDTSQKILAMRLKSDAIDAILVMQLKNVEKSTSYVPGNTYYGGYYGYGYYGSYYSSPGYYTEDQTFLVETSFYEAATGKLLWAGTTTTLNPSSLDQSMDEIIYSIKFYLTNKGIIKP